MTQFTVRPISNIKGDLTGTVTVEQLGGYQGGILYTGESGDIFGPNSRSGEGYMLQPGSTYLLSTRYEDDDTYYLWDFPTASKLISQNGNLSDSQLQAVADSDARVKQLEAAYPHEILVADDVRNNNTRNSYASLHQAAPPPPVITVQDSAPTISSLTSIVGSTSTVMTWITDKPATSQLLFGPTMAMGENTTSDTALVTSHTMVTSGLTPGTTYYYEVQSKDGSGTISTSAQQSFVFGGQSSSAESLGGN